MLILRKVDQTSNWKSCTQFCFECNTAFTSRWFETTFKVFNILKVRIQFVSFDSNSWIGGILRKHVWFEIDKFYPNFPSKLSTRLPRGGFELSVVNQCFCLPWCQLILNDLERSVELIILDITQLLLRDSCFEIIKSKWRVRDILYPSTENNVMNFLCKT